MKPEYGIHSSVKTLTRSTHTYVTFVHLTFYNLFTFSWPRFESGSLRNGGMLILRIYFAVDGMPIEMYGESWIAGLLISDDVMLYMAGFETKEESNGTYCAFMA